MENDQTNLTPKQQREREKMRARKEHRATYDLPPVLRERIKDLAEQQRVPTSQLVALALARFIRELEEERLDLGEFKQPSRSPRYDWNLAIPERLLPKRKRARRKPAPAE